MLIVIALAIVVIAAMEWTSFIRKRQWKTLFVHSVVLVVGASLLLYGIHTDSLPSPIHGVVRLFSPISNMVFPLDQ